MTTLFLRGRFPGMRLRLQGSDNTWLLLFFGAGLLWQAENSSPLPKDGYAAGSANLSTLDFCLGACYTLFLDGRLRGIVDLGHLHHSGARFWSLLILWLWGSGIARLWPRLGLRLLCCFLKIFLMNLLLGYKYRNFIWLLQLVARAVIRRDRGTLLCALLLYCNCTRCLTNFPTLLPKW